MCAFSPARGSLVPAVQGLLSELERVTSWQLRPGVTPSFHGHFALLWGHLARGSKSYMCLVRLPGVESFRL